jgi:hypothetical protein
MKNYIVISLLLLVIVSCTKTIEFDDEGFANQLVVTSIISPGNHFQAYLTHSNSILEDQKPNPPAEGSLELYENENLIKEFSTQLGAFSDSLVDFKAGKTYRFVVNSKGKKLETETTIPEAAVLVSADTVSVKNEYGQREFIFKLTINDVPGEDFYRIVVMKESLTTSDYITQENQKKTAYYLDRAQYSLQSEDPVFKSVYNNFGDDLINYGPNNDYFIFPDDYFQGKEYTLQFAVWNYGYSYYNPYGNGNPGNPNGGNGVIYEKTTIHIQRLSKDFYLYLKYLKLYDHYRDNPFAEPVPVYSNVKNGAGIFAGFNDNTTIEFEKIYIPFSMDTIKVEENSYGGYIYW